MDKKEKRKFIIINNPSGYPTIIEEDTLKPLYEEETNRENEEDVLPFSELTDDKYFRGWIPIWSAFACELSDLSPVGSYIVTKLLIIINILLFIPLFTLIVSANAFQYYPSPACIVNWSCIGSIFLAMFAHADPLHLLGNMIFLYIVGDNVEITLGRIRYLIIYFTAGFLGAYLQGLFNVFIDPAASFYVGASGAISGLIGAYLVLYPGSSMCWCWGFQYIYKCFKVKASVYLSLWILFQFLYLLLVHNIAIWAHLGGLVVGAALAWLLADKGRIEQLRKEIAGYRYRGLSPIKGELRRHSIIPLAVIVVIATAMSITAILAYTTYQSPVYEGKYVTYYMVIEREYSDGTLLVNGRRVEHIDHIIGLNMEIKDKPPDKNEVVENTICHVSPGYRCLLIKRVVRIEYLNTLPIKILATNTILLTLTIIAVYVILVAYKDIEVTYIPRYLGEQKDVLKE